jgi:hypothetical protein
VVADLFIVGGAAMALAYDVAASRDQAYQPVELCRAQSGERVDQLRARGREDLHPSMISHRPNRTVTALRDIA